MTEIREIVLPGEFLGKKEGRKVGEYAYFEGENVFSKVVGIPKIGENEINVIPLFGVYIPHTGDSVVGIVKSVEVSGWFVDINSPYIAFLPLAEGVGEFVDIYRTDLSKFFDENDVIYCRVSKVTKSKIVQVSMRAVGCRKLRGGTIIRVNPAKIPRIIGRRGSMINLIKRKTGCEIYPGRNGIIWLRGGNKPKAIEAILTIEKESHIIGLTEKIEKMLSGDKK